MEKHSDTMYCPVCDKAVEVPHNLEAYQRICTFVIEDDSSEHQCGSELFPSKSMHEALTKPKDQ